MTTLDTILLSALVGYISGSMPYILSRAANRRAAARDREAMQRLRDMMREPRLRVIPNGDDAA